MMRKHLFIGAMSGTSMDGLDLALVEISEKKINTLASHSEDLPPSLRDRLQRLCTPSENEIEISGQADVEFALLTAKAVNSLLEKNNLSPSDIQAIGSHGQTIRHKPYAKFPFSLQIGNPSVIAHQTKITTIADFRMADIAAGGQGAPLVPAFHEAVFSSNLDARAIVNIGGIANISLLNPLTTATGYDMGPGNTLLDQWIQKNKSLPFDQNGQWGESGALLPELLSALKQDTFIQKKPPKSTGREYFNLCWLNTMLMKTYPENTSQVKPADIQHTLTEFTAQSIADSIPRNTHTKPCDIFFCGGGVRNTFLMQRLKSLLPNHNIATTESLGVDPQLVEASAFAWLASRTLAGLDGNIREVTGANAPKILGGIYPA